MPISNELLEDLAQRFRSHSEEIYGVANANSSPLYAHLAGKIATDPAILTLVANADRATQVTNLLFGAVHFLLLSGDHHSLQGYYPDLTNTPRPIAESYPHFRTFCLEHTTEIETLVTTRRVQTNEVTRCAALLPSFTLISQREDHKPIAMVEIGTSAGFHLLWDRFYYDYGPAGYAGEPEALVKIRTNVYGEHQPPVRAQMPAAISNIGIDLFPIDAYDEDATRWLRALIWPEHRDRAALLESALNQLRLTPVNTIQGNAAEMLPEVLAEVPPEAALCICYSYTFVQMPPAIREQILAHLGVFAEQRDFYRISQEWFSGQPHPFLELYSYRGGKMQRELLAHVESHGRWIEWLQ
jgi:hypothetical protein